jgi:hypothetical protein
MIAYYTICPCKDCTKRVLACHSGCKDYNEWKGNAVEVKEPFREFDPKRKRRRRR